MLNLNQKYYIYLQVLKHLKKKIIKICFSYGDLSTLEKNIQITNQIYGGLDIANKVTNAVFVHGSLDHWHALGVIESNNTEAPAIFIKGRGLCSI